MKFRSVIFLSVFLLSGNFGWRLPVFQMEGERYFEETGHRVTGEFLEFYRQVDSPLLVYGYPITDAYQDPTTRIIVQYFQKARFELHPESPQGLRVQLSPLGEYMYEPGPLLPVSENFTACRAFAPRGYRVCYAFLDFFDANGGVGQFGYPISDIEFHDDRIAQYFQRARFEWHPENPVGNRVVLADMGTQYFYLRGENQIRLLADRDGKILNSVMELKVRAYPSESVASLQGEQTVHVLVQDQKMHPVSNARISLIIRLPSGEEQQYDLQSLTNEDGVADYTFPYKSEVPGEVEINVMATYGHIDKSTVTSYRAWW